MMTLRKFILTAGLIALGGSVTACSAFSDFSEIDALNDAQAVGTEFTQALTQEYRAFSNTELQDMLDYPDALHFARKGLAAASGDIVLPEPIADWNLSEEHEQELGAARERLIIAYDYGARESMPEIAAIAQTKFDCWIEGQEEEWRDSTANCKSDFFQALEQLEANLQPPPAPIEPIAEEANPFAVDADAPMDAANAMYIVFFDWDSSKLTAGALNVLDAVAQEVAANTPNSLNLAGHTDTSGSKAYNERLARKRADRVKNALIERGVPAGIINTTASGESELLVATPDNVREPANRRVNISFE
ncbi:MAG: OmpA family protein [Alphaproteobacteria bacterium]